MPAIALMADWLLQAVGAVLVSLGAVRSTILIWHLVRRAQRK